MHIGLVIYGPLDDRSGGFLYDQKLVRHFRESGDRVTVYSLPERSYPLQFIDNFNGRFWRKLARMSLDVLLQDELNHLSLCLGNYWLRSVAKYPIVSIVHHLKSDENHHSLLNTFIRRLEALYLQSTDGIICNSESTLQSVKRVGGKNPSVVAYPGGDRLNSALTEDEIVQHAQQAGPLRLIFVGNVIPRKGLHWVIEGLATLEESSWTFDVIGSLPDPTYAHHLLQAVESKGLSDQVSFLGRVSDAELHRHMSNSHVFVMPSSHEGFGIAYIEAFAFGMPVIANEKGGQTEIIKHTQNGVLLDNCDPMLLQNWVRHLDTNRGVLAEMSVAALRQFKSHPTWEASAAKVRGFLKSLVDEHHE